MQEGFLNRNPSCFIRKPQNFLVINYFYLDDLRMNGYYHVRGIQPDF